MNIIIKTLTKKKKILIPTLILCIAIGIIYIFSNSNYYADKVQAEQVQKQETDALKQKENEKINADKFIYNLDNRKFDICIQILDNSKISVNYVLEDGDTLYNKTLNTALEKSADPINLASDYLPLLYKMRTTADKNSIKLYTENINQNQSIFLDCLSIDSTNKKTESTASNENITSSNTQTNNSAKPKTQNFNMNGLELLEHSASKEGYYITGKIKNNNSFNCSYVEVQVKITNNNGDVLDTPVANVTNLKSGETWSFEIPAIVDTTSPYKYQFIYIDYNS